MSTSAERSLLKLPWALAGNAQSPWIRNSAGDPALECLFTGPDKIATRKAFVEHVNASVGDNRISNALAIAQACGQTDGEHHKAWVIDQMVRELLRGPDDSLDRYHSFLANFRAGEEGPDTYSWNEGTPPCRQR